MIGCLLFLRKDACLAHRHRDFRHSWILAFVATLLLEGSMHPHPPLVREFEDAGHSRAACNCARQVLRHEVRAGRVAKFFEGGVHSVAEQLDVRSHPVGWSSGCFNPL